MSNKPQMKRTIGITLVHELDRTITFYASEWAAQAVAEFGTARLPDDAEPRPGVLNCKLPPILTASED